VRHDSGVEKFAARKRSQLSWKVAKIMAAVAIWVRKLRQQAEEG
jgi:hypothetical protein